jgi:hypothetical protein
MSTKKTIPTPGKALENCLKTLENLDQFRRAGRGPTSRDYAACFSQYVDQRCKLTAAERIETDTYSQSLWKGYTVFLAEQDAGEQAERPSLPARRDRRQDTTAPRRSPEPCGAIPGSENRLRELSRRRRLGMDLRAPDDVTDDPARGLETLSQRNGAARSRAVGAKEVSRPADGKKHNSPQDG